ncbi:MAG: hypothetical protein COW65_03950 [Cytophagales bacterium CG18_big_fil_WC_8_21_14_2_50_42_9]|nr:MAG: hypothetical protein COW65_03950 [Cytophagales bacterium CG18_big_fil_WC_8_21_14_2_50_42_9]
MIAKIINQACKLKIKIGSVISTTSNIKKQIANFIYGEASLKRLKMCAMIFCLINFIFYSERG